MPPTNFTLPRRRLHRATFMAAGIYNIVWGIFAAIDPQWMFRFAGMPPLNHPQIFACLGMVLGLYGVLYLEIARRPEHNWVPAAIGFSGKIMGPLGLLQLIWTGAWPPASAVMCITNDLIWWIPFGLYLYDAWPTFRASWQEG